MSKCKAVLDDDKITEIRVKTKVRENPQKDISEAKNLDVAKRTSTTTLQQPR